MVILVVEVMMNDGDHCGGGPVKESPEGDTGSMGVQVNMSLMSALYQLLRNDFRIRRSQEIHGHDQGIVLVPWRRNEQQNSFVSTSVSPVCSRGARSSTSRHCDKLLR